MCEHLLLIAVKSTVKFQTSTCSHCKYSIQRIPLKVQEFRISNRNHSLRSLTSLGTNAVKTVPLYYQKSHRNNRTLSIQLVRMSLTMLL
jgi:hypothetical protein